MRTTLDLNDDLVARAKAYAARKRTTLTRLIEEGLQLRLREGAPRSRETVELPVFHGKGGLRPGIDPRSNRSLLQATEEFDVE